MTVTVETLEKLERKMTLTLPVGSIQSEVESRLKKLARTVKMDGFRPGKVPMNVVAQRYGYSVHYEVMNDKVGEAFASAANEAKLRVAGQPRITESGASPDGAMAFDAVFEVFPEVKIADLSTAEVERITADVTDSAIDKTLEILRKQRRTFAQRAHDAAAQEGDRATVDFEGKIDGEVFSGGKAEDFQFIIGDGQMLKEFEDATRGMKSGESKTFQLAFPADYHGKDVAGKTADFMVTVKKVEAAHLPDVNEALAKAQAVAERFPGAVVIGSDQVADLDGQAQGKPGEHARAVLQLRQMSGKVVIFQTAIAVVCLESGFCQEALAPVKVKFRDLSDWEIENYLQAEQPYDCAGSAKSEGLGIALLERIDNDDPTALIGLPLIRTATLLRAAGIDLLANALSPKP